MICFKCGEFGMLGTHGFDHFHARFQEVKLHHGCLSMFVQDTSGYNSTTTLSCEFLLDRLL